MWRPLGERTGRRNSGHDQLHDGIPAWMHASILSWVIDAIQHVSGGYGYAEVRDVLMSIERDCRVTLSWRSTENAVESLTELASTDEAAFIDVLDYLAHRLGEYSDRVGGLEHILESSGSIWRVITRHEGVFLEERVDVAVAARAEEVMAQSDRAGKHLERAWHALYRRNPDPSAAYREAVRAVEAAAQPVLLPRDASATLGKMIATVRDSPREKWMVALQSGQTHPTEGLLSMLQLLWHGQHDRHGTADEGVPLTVAPREAEAAVHLAITLVHWFTSGLVRTA
jgi:hypothetical protein